MLQIKSNPFICTLTFYVIVIQGVIGIVKVGFNVPPKPRVSQTDNLTILNNSNVDFGLQCYADYPTEWIFDNDDISKNEPNRYVDELSLREFVGSSDEKTFYSYDALIEFTYIKLIEEENLICRSTQNHTDQLQIKISPNTVNSQVHITKHEVNPTSTTIAILPDSSPPVTNECGPINFRIIQLPSGYYWQCSVTSANNRSSTLLGHIKFHYCSSSAFCANKFRVLKQYKPCVTILNSTTTPSNPEEWKLMVDDEVEIPGVAVCTINEGRRAALEYFFTGVSKENNNQRQLRFSWSEIKPEEMIWLNSTIRDVYYVHESLQSNCIVPLYGFSYFPGYAVILNGSRILSGSRILEENQFQETGPEVPSRNYTKTLLSKGIDISFLKHGPGYYEIHCIGAVWNTTEWANHTISFIVKYPTPYFQTPSENITLEDGDNNQKLECDALGDPKPNKFTWDSAIIPQTRSFGNTFLFSRVLKTWHDGAHITCTATNEFEQHAIKTFHIHVNKGKSSTMNPNEQTVSITILTIIIFGLIFGILLIAGLLFSYFKFRKLGAQFATHLTKEEVKEFHEGKSNESRKTMYENNKPGQPGDIAEDHCTIAIECLSYNSAFEVAKQNLVVDFSAEIGSGQFGVVYKGRVTPNGKGATAIQIAVKTVRKNVDITYFKALLSELKILAYVGRHDHLANLICAWTEDIKKRELFVGIELCQTSLLKYLQDNRRKFNSCVSTEGVLTTSRENDAHDIGDEFTTYTLIKWAREISSGMEFLSSKKVVHADLAARNILLSFDSQAKICDFGLARQLVNYIYIKSETCPLPWAWMAIEPLTERTFSSMSDVWSYGVVLWELFSLGKMPYPGFSWSAEFMNQLTSGERMPKPDYATDPIYINMLKCWAKDPTSRPKFQDLTIYFETMEVNNDDITTTTTNT